MSVFLGIDTSNYTTSCALCSDGEITANRKKLLEVEQGGRGLRQSDALFAHTVNLPGLVESLGKLTDITAIGYSAYPRDCEGSYMPCFLAGSTAAKMLSSALGVKLFKFSHQAGHIMAAAYSAGCRELLGGRLLAFHVSGGTTELLLVDNMKITKIGGTLDLNAGQAIDRIGVMLGLKFPCGRELEELSDRARSPEKPKICVNGLNCNLSGVENKAKGMLERGVSREEIAAYTIDFVKLTIAAMSENAIDQYGELPIIYAGGVMSNRRINSYISGRFDAHFAAPEFSSDNAAGIALLCEQAYEAENCE